MYDLHVLNPFLSSAINARQVHLTTPIGNANRVQTNLVFKKPCTDILVFEYVEGGDNTNQIAAGVDECHSGHDCRNNHYWSIAIKDGQNYTSADQLFAFINQQLTISSIQPSLLQIAKDCTIRFNMPKIIIRCSKQELLARLGTDTVISKIYCKFMHDGSSNILILGDTNFTDITINAAYSDDTYDLFFATDYLAASFNEPYSTSDFGIKNDMESFKINKKTNNFTIMYRQNTTNLKKMGSNLNITFSSIICVETFDELVKTICTIILTQYNKINQNYSRLFTENELMTEINFNKKCVEQCFRFAIEELVRLQIRNKKGNGAHYFNKFSNTIEYSKRFLPEKVKAIDSMQSYLDLWDIDISMLAIGIGASILFKIGMPVPKICDLFTTNAVVSMDNTRKKKFMDDLRMFITRFADSYIDHVFSVMCFSMTDENDVKIVLKNTSDLVTGTYANSSTRPNIIYDDAQKNVLRFNKYLFVVFYVFLSNNINNQLTTLSGVDRSNIFANIYELYKEIGEDDKSITTKIIENKVKTLILLTRSTGKANKLMSQLWGISRCISDNGLEKKSYDFYLIKKNSDGILHLTNENAKMHSSNTNSVIHSQHDVQVISHISDYVTKPVSVTDIVTTTILANGVLGDDIARHVVPFSAWTITKNKTLSCCTKKFSDSLISYCTRLTTIVDELGGLNSNTLLCVAAPMLGLFNIINGFRKNNVSHCDLKADNFLVELIMHQKSTPCGVDLPDFKSSIINDYVKILTNVDKNDNPPLQHEFLIKMIELESYTISPTIYVNDRKKTVIHNIPSVSIAISSREMLCGLASIDSFDCYPLWLMCINTAVLLPLQSFTNAGCNMKLLVLVINQQIKNHLESKSTFYQYLGSHIRRFFVNTNLYGALIELCWELRTQLVLKQIIDNTTRALYLRLLHLVLKIGLIELNSVRCNHDSHLATNLTDAQISMHDVKNAKATKVSNVHVATQQITQSMANAPIDVSRFVNTILLGDTKSRADSNFKKQYVVNTKINSANDLKYT